MNNDYSHTHREYDVEGRVVLEVFEDDMTRVVESFQYEGEWTIREQKHISKDSEDGFLCIERFKNDGSAWTQKMFDLKTGRLESEMREIETKDGTIWHDTTYHEDGSVKRAVHTTRPIKEGTLEQTIVDGKIESYSIIKHNAEPNIEDS